jgi:hypothetical protein
MKRPTRKQAHRRQAAAALVAVGVAAGAGKLADAGIEQLLKKPDPVVQENGPHTVSETANPGEGAITLARRALSQLGIEITTDNVAQTVDVIEKQADQDGMPGLQIGETVTLAPVQPRSNSHVAGNH